MRILAALLASFLTAIAYADNPAVINLTFDTTANQVILPAGSATPAADPNGKIRVVVTGATTAQASTWKFRLDGNDMDRPDPAKTEWEDTAPASGESTVTFADSGVTMNPRTIKIPVGAATPPPPDSTGVPAATAPFRNGYDRRNDAVYLSFDPGGRPLRAGIPRDIDDNDAITIWIEATSEEAEHLGVEIEGNLADSSLFAVLGSGELTALTKKVGEIRSKGLPDPVIPHLIGTFGPFAGPSIVIKITSTASGSKVTVHQHAVPINKTYVAAYRLAAIPSGIRFNKFEVTSRAGQTGTFIENTSDPDGELRYLVTLVPYGWNWRRPTHWRGRDIAEPPSIADRFNPVLGVGVRDPRNEYFLGASVELARALDLVVGWHRVSVDQLGGGYKEGDPFTGDAATVPKRQRADDEILAGFSLDLRVATQLVTALFQ